MLSSFSYHSNEVHSVNGKTRKNIVNIKNGKGIKRVEEYDNNDKLLHKSQKALKSNEVACIKRKQFMPGLFKSCMKGGTRRNRRSDLRK